MMKESPPSITTILFQRAFGFIRVYKFPILIFIVACAVRIVYLIDYSHSPFFQGYLADAYFHEEWARNILHGDVFSLRIQGVFYKAPFYPYFIAFVYFITDHSDFILMLVQVIMSGVSCVFLFLIGRIYFNDIAAFIGTIMYVFYFPSVFFSTEMEIPAIAVFLTLISFYLVIVNKRTLYIIVSSVFFGFSILALPTNLLLFPLYIFILFQKRGIKAAVLFFIITSATIFPCTLRNIITGHSLTLVSANGGINFYIGNNGNYDDTVYLQPGYAFEEFYDEPRRTDGADSFTERDAYWYEKAFDFILKNPAKEIFLLAKKLVLYFSDYEIYRNTDTYYAKDNSIYRCIPFFPASIVMATGLGGLFRAVYGKKNGTLTALCVSLALPCIIFFVTDRYRLPSMCIWALFSGYCISSVVDSLRSGSWLPGTLSIAATFCLVILSCTNTFVVKNPGYRPHFNLGIIYEQRMKYDSALEEYSISITYLKSEKPSDFRTESEAYTRMGNCYLKMNKFEEAQENLDKAIEINPDSYPAYSYLGTLYERKKENDMAIKMYNKAIEIDPLDAISIYNLGLFYLNNSLFDEAMTEFKRAIEVYPQHSGAHSNLAYIYGMQENYDLMEVHAKEAIRFDPEEIPSRYNLAMLYQNTGRIEEAVSQYKTITRIAPRDSANACNSLGVIYARNNDLKQAILYWKKALEADPDHENAKYNLQKAMEIIGL